MQRAPRSGPAPRTTPVNCQEPLDSFPAERSLIDALTGFALALDKVVKRPMCIALGGLHALRLDPPEPNPGARAFMIDQVAAHIHDRSAG